MFAKGFGVLALVTAFASTALGEANWPSNQVNTTICQWQQLRAAVLRDTVYLDGGSLWWLPGFNDGSYGATVNDINLSGTVFTLNFSMPFNTTQNITAVFGTVTKPGGGGASNLAPNYIDGAMLANDDEWFLYGGYFKPSAAYSNPHGDEVLEYQEYQYGPVKESFKPGTFLNAPLGSDVTPYITYGGAANVPSENKAFYFSGFQTPSKGPIYDPSVNTSTTASVPSNTLITLDMTTQQQEKWSNKTLPDGIAGRANPELVWVPVGSQGILVSLGGVVFPDFALPFGATKNKTQSQAQSPLFMSNIDIYDIAADEWYSQPTAGGPGQLTRGCAVLATAHDNSSYNIYYYGGYDGLDKTQPFNDDVWVLSLPSFTWTKIASGAGLGRAGHKCVTPYPDQMFVIGGYPSVSKSAMICLPNLETIRVFNLSTGTWLSGYDPTKWANYTVPDAITKKIGGSATGGATAASPSPSWVSKGLSDVFGTKYTKEIPVYYPYTPTEKTNNTNPNTPPAPTETSGGGGVPSYLAPVLGVVLGLMLLTMIAVLILLYRRRKILKGSQSDAGTEETNGHRIMSWMRGQAVENKAPTVTTVTDYPSVTPGPTEDLESTSSPPPQTQSMAEIMSREIQPPVEMWAPTAPVELHDTGLSHVDILNRHTHLNSSPAQTGSLNNTSSFSNGTQQIDHASTFTHSSAGLPPPNPNAFDYRPDSDLLPSANLTNSPQPYSPQSSSASPTGASAAAAARRNVISDVSNVSENQRAHLRQISADTTVSAATATSGAAGTDRVMSGSSFAPPVLGDLPAAQEYDHDAGTLQSPAAAGAAGSPQPVSPPTGGYVDGEDYMSVRPHGSGLGPVGMSMSDASGSGSGIGIGNLQTTATSPIRRSVFSESQEDMNGAGSGARGV
ncbi:hypothetical protein B0T19DRAFT_444102 [Cercophora scortea]|uniref:Kelch repeat-containing protein n=1 Tax=Cercophora scortea TaxID=314031 RepID=A0AAE0M9T7_9PEZI|nr:hypothetical protein B0T19DRAFT_444102 [Cercophora scortea]